MKVNLLTRSIMAASLTAVLASCGGSVEKGYDPQYGSDAPVEWDENAPFAKTITVDDGVVQIDLSEGATVNGNALDLSTNVYFREFLIIPREVDGVTVGIPVRPGLPELNENPGGNVSAFAVTDKNTHELNVVSYAYRNFLSVCEGSNLPSEAVVDITYHIDNGYKFPLTNSDGSNFEIPLRHLALTIQGMPVELESLESDKESMEITQGETGVFTITKTPETACSDWTIAYDDSIISVVASESDSSSMVVTGIATGTTNIVITKGDIVETVSVNVVPPADREVVIANKDADGTVAIPECMNSALYADVMVGGEPAMATYAWTSNNAAIATETSNGVIGGTGFMNLQAPTAVVDEMSTVDVELTSGSIGGIDFDVTDVTDVANVKVTDNAACDPIPDPAVVNAFDGQFEVIQYWLKADSNPGWWPNHQFSPYTGSVLTTTADGITGNAMTVTAPADATAETEVGTYYQSYFVNPARASMIMHNRINKTGIQIKTSVWVKLSDLPAEGNLTMRHYINSQGWTGYGSYVPENGENKYNKHRRESPAAGHFEAVLKNTTDWQYVEFTNSRDASGSHIWTVPDNWFSLANGVDGSSSNWQFSVTGLGAGQSFKLDEYSMMIVDYPSDAEVPPRFNH